MKCQICDGKGGWTEVIDWEIGGPYFDCYNCDGTGEVRLIDYLWQWLWEHAPIRFVEWYGDFLWDRQKEEDV